MWSGVDTDETYEMMSVMEGDSVILNTDVTEIKSDDPYNCGCLNSKIQRIESLKSINRITSIYDNKEKK